MCTEENKADEEQEKEIFRHEQGEITVNFNYVKAKAKKQVRRWVKEQRRFL